jgi:ABC-type transporter Mla MlaB component
MTFKIERTHSGEVITLRLIGGLNSECLGELKQQIEHAGLQVVLDLAEVELVDVDVVRFLNACQDDGAVIANDSPYIREWMLRERISMLPTKEEIKG